MYNIIILPAAKQDIKQIALWYNDQQKGLGKRFTQNVRKKMGFVQQNPLAIAIRHNDIRTAIVDVFPYMIHFHVDPTKKQVVVVAVYGTAQDPKQWEKT